MPASLPTDHDDDDGGLVRCPAVGTRNRRGIGVTSTSRDRHRRRTARQSITDLVHDPGCLSLPRSDAPALSTDAQESGGRQAGSSMITLPSLYVAATWDMLMQQHRADSPRWPGRRGTNTPRSDGLTVFQEGRRLIRGEGEA